MFSHIALEVADLGRSAAFYDPLLHSLGGRRMFEADGAIAYGRIDPRFWIVARGRTHSGEWGHLALTATGRAAVDAAHAAGLANGGTDDGAPGPRPQYGSRYYAGYLRDPDGHRIEIASGEH